MDSRRWFNNKQCRKDTEEKRKASFSIMNNKLLHDLTKNKKIQLNNKVHNVHLNQSLQLYLSQSNSNSQLEVVHKKTMKDRASKRRLSNFPNKLYSLFDNNKNSQLGKTKTKTKAKLNRYYINASMTLLTPKIKSFNPIFDYSLPYNDNYVKSSYFYQNKASESSLSCFANLTKLTSISKKISLKALDKREISKNIQ